MNQSKHIELDRIARDVLTRAAGVVGLAGIALIHLLDAPSKFAETPYVGWLYVGLIAGSIAVAGALIHKPSRAAWLAGAGLATCAIAGYVASRTTGLPGAMGDIGNWTEPLGLASLFVEGAVVTISAYAIATFGGVREVVSRPFAALA